MQIDSSTSQTINNSQSTNSFRKTSILGKDDFLKLLVTQLSYQDPLEPVKNEEFIAQTAQFSALEQMQNLNDNFIEFMAKQTMADYAAASQFVGKEVKVESSTFAIENSEPMPLGFILPQRAEVTVDIYDAKSTLGGDLVKQLELGTQDADTHQVVLANETGEGASLPDGVYTYSITAINEAGESVEVNQFISGQVDSVIYEDKQAFLSINGQLIPVENILSVENRD